MATSNVTITVKAKLRGMWRIKAAMLVLRWARPVRLAAWLTCWLVSGKAGVDLKVGPGRWERGPRVEVTPRGD